MKHHFFVIYALQGENAFRRFSCGIEVEYSELDTAKFIALTKATAMNHNSTDDFHLTSRKIIFTEVAFHAIVKV